MKSTVPNLLYPPRQRYFFKTRTIKKCIFTDFLQPFGQANVFKILANGESTLPNLRYPLGNIYAFQFLTAFKRLLLYLHFPFGDDAHTILYVISVFLVSCHGSKSYVGQSYKIYFIQPSEIRRNMINRKERKRHKLRQRKTKKPNRASGLYVVRKCAENIPQKVKWDIPNGKMGHPKW